MGLSGSGAWELCRQREVQEAPTRTQLSVPEPGFQLCLGYSLGPSVPGSL